METHALIKDFLKNKQLVGLAGNRSLLPPERYTKAGVIPFYRDTQHIQYYVMKPRAERPDLPPPEFQICKGTRMQQGENNGPWVDMRSTDIADGNSEPLVMTGLREGMEELGLELGNITRLYEMGGYDFSSATTGKGKQVWLFAAEIKNRDDFRETEASTLARQWVSIADFAVVGRRDHRYIIEHIDNLLRKESSYPLR